MRAETWGRGGSQFPLSEGRTSQARKSVQRPWGRSMHGMLEQWQKWTWGQHTTALVKCLKRGKWQPRFLQTGSMVLLNKTCRKTTQPPPHSFADQVNTPSETSFWNHLLMWLCSSLDWGQLEAKMILYSSLYLQGLPKGPWHWWIPSKCLLGEWMNIIYSQMYLHPLNHIQTLIYQTESNQKELQTLLPGPYPCPGEPSPSDTSERPAVFSLKERRL